MRAKRRNVQASSGSSSGDANPKGNPQTRDLRTVRDGEIFKTLASGIQIVRRRKHEWRAKLAKLEKNEFIVATNPINGSKFSREWTRTQYVRWLEKQAHYLSWHRDTPNTEVEVQVSATVGWSSGRAVSRIRIELSSGIVHAYPVAA